MVANKSRLKVEIKAKYINFNRKTKKLQHPVITIRKEEAENES